MSDDKLKEYYEEKSSRFWDPKAGLTGRDLIMYPLLKGLSGSLLEYGCGSGSLLLGLAKEDRFTKCYGVDLSEKLLKWVKDSWIEVSSLPDKVETLTPQSDLLPEIPSGSIDVVISVATIEHVINPYVVLDELHRIAKPGATLLCSVPNYAYLKHRLTLLFGNQPRTGTDLPPETWREGGWDGMHLHTFTQSSFKILLKDCGWVPQKWSGWGYKGGKLGLKLRQMHPGLLSGEIIAVCKKK
jgi:2-polyprenyl-3-methyl-5-hydroxy-6-metoxy-1,4-benzoquinol methylase